MEEVIVSKMWMALVFGVMALYTVLGFVGMRVKSGRERRD